MTFHQEVIIFVIFPQKLQLRVVQTQAIFYSKSMSENVGSDIERLRIWMNWIFNIDLMMSFKIQNRSMLDPTLSDIDFKIKESWRSWGTPTWKFRLENKREKFSLFLTPRSETSKPH